MHCVQFSLDPSFGMHSTAPNPYTAAAAATLPPKIKCASHPAAVMQPSQLQQQQSHAAAAQLRLQELQQQLVLARQQLQVQDAVRSSLQGFHEQLASHQQVLQLQQELSAGELYHQRSIAGALQGPKHVACLLVSIVATV